MTAWRAEEVPSNPAGWLYTVAHNKAMRTRSARVIAARSQVVRSTPSRSPWRTGRAGLSMLDDITGLDGYHLYWAARGELLARSGDPVAATGSG